MKKPRKPKNKSRRGTKRGRDVARAPSPATGKATRRHPATTAERTAARPQVRRRSSVAAAYEADDRQALALLMLPLFLMAFAVAGTQAARTVPSFPDLVAKHAPAKTPAPPVKKAAPTLQERIAAMPLTPLAESPARQGVPLVPAAAADLGLPVTGDPPSEVATQVPPEEVRPGSTQEAIAIAPVTTPNYEAELSAGKPSMSAPTGPAVCVADERAKMKRTASLGALVPATDPEAFGHALAASARKQLGDFVIYTDKYHLISYPRGDVPPLYGVCTDVIIRAYHGVGLDLQELVHKAKVGIGDANIDHRRVKTLQRFFKKFGETLPISEFAEDFKPGDIVTYYRPRNRGSNNHIAIVSDVYAPSGRPMIIHNRGWGPQQEDALFVDEITGHFRFTGAKLPPALRKSLQANAGNSDSVNDTTRRSTNSDVVRASLTPSARSNPSTQSAAP